MLKARWSDKFSVSSVSNASFLSCSCTLWLGAVLDLINPIWKLGINFGKGWEKKKPNPSPERTKTHPQGFQGADSCWESPADCTSEPSKHVTVIRMWLKLVQLHLSTYIPTSFPSCLSLLMAYSVLQGNGQWAKTTKEQPKIWFWGWDVRGNLYLGCSSNLEMFMLLLK